MKNMHVGRALAALLLAFPLPGCDKLLPGRSEMSVPTSAQADSLFRAHGVHGTVEIHGNVVEFTASQAGEQLKRGGALWARVGPYIYLFSPATPELFEQYPGVAAVRTRTQYQGREVARVQVVRDTLRAGEWQHARALLALALSEGTRRPSRLEELVRFGERFASYEYNPAWVKE